LRREFKLLVCLVVLGAVGFASASIVSGANASSADTTVTATTATPPQTVTVTNTVVRRVTVKKRVIVVLCHRTPAGRFLTTHVPLSVSVLAAHLRHGDLTGKCTAAKVRLMKKQLRTKRG
jgi:hypothetical protein